MSGETQILDFQGPHQGLRFLLLFHFVSFHQETTFQLKLSAPVGILTQYASLPSCLARLKLLSPALLWICQNHRLCFCLQPPPGRLGLNTCLSIQSPYFHHNFQMLYFFSLLKKYKKILPPFQQCDFSKYYNFGNFKMKFRLVWKSKQVWRMT